MYVAYVLKDILRICRTVSSCIPHHLSKGQLAPLWML